MLESSVEEKNGKSAIIHANLIPFMISSTICLDGCIGESINYCLENYSSFVHCIEWLFEQAEDISDLNNYEFMKEYEILTEKQQKYIFK